jgi:hypothetical protein
VSWTHLSSHDGVKARKEHQCYYCNEMIEVGSLYGKRTGVCYGEISFMKYHPECDNAAKHWKQDDYECFSQGDMKRPKPDVAAKETPKP